MIRKLLLPLMLLTTAPAQAFDLNGGKLGVTETRFGDGEDDSKTAYDGQIELGFDETFALQLDTGIASYDAHGWDSRYMLLHGFFHVTPETSVGLFLGRETFEDKTFTLTGAEIDYQQGKWDLEAYVAKARTNGYTYDTFPADVSGTVFGARADYDITSNAQLGLRFDRSNIEYNPLKRVALTAEYRLPAGLALTGEIGKYGFDSRPSESFVSLGLEFKFGKNGDVTYHERNLSQLYMQVPRNGPPPPAPY